MAHVFWSMIESMDKKKPLRSLLIVLIVLLVTVLGYFLLLKKPNLPETSQSTSQHETNNQSPRAKARGLIKGMIVRFYAFIPGLKPGVFSQKSNNQTVTSNQALPTTCTDDEAEGAPVITSISAFTGSVGTKIEIGGCNFLGFEGDKNVWIENSQGTKGILYGESGSTAKKIIFTLKSPLCQKDTSYSGLPCNSWLVLSPGIYNIYIMPWGKISNPVNFTIK